MSVIALQERGSRRSEPPLPHDLDAEASVLGGIILRNDVLLQLETLEIEDFYHPHHKVVFEAIRNLEAAGKPIDVVTLEGEIARRGKLEAIGGVGLFGELALRVPTLENVPIYAATVGDHSRNRKVILELADAAQRTRNQPGEAMRIARDVTARLAALHAPVEQSAATKMVCLANVVAESVRWLWPARIPLGMLTLIDGDPGLGKSTVTLDIAARVTTGAPMPCDPEGRRRPPAAVILMTAEDSLSATIRPRLDAAKADARRVHAITAMPRRNDPDALPTLAPEDVARLQAAIEEHRAELVIVDPLMAFLPGEIDSYRDQDVRRTLRPLAAVAEHTSAAIVIVRHLKKGAGSALYRGSGSVGIVGAARSALMVMVAADPDDETARIMASSKSNLAPLAPALRWRLVDAGGVGCIEWEGVADGVTADDLAQQAVPKREDDEAGLQERAESAWREVLANGKVPSKDAVRDVAQMTGASERTIRRAREKIGVEHVREGGRIWLYLTGQRDHTGHTGHAGQVESETSLNHASEPEKSDAANLATRNLATPHGRYEREGDL
jgi:hypothetical protein